MLYDYPVLDPLCAEPEPIAAVREEPALYSRFLTLPPEIQEHFPDFCTGKLQLQDIRYFLFRLLLHPGRHPGRLESFLSQIIGEPVLLQRLPYTVPSYPQSFSSGNDLCTLVRLRSGALCRMEIRTSPYLPCDSRSAPCFAGPAPDSCLHPGDTHPEDMPHGGIGNGETYFSRLYLSRIYTIILVEKSSGGFLRYSDQYIHRSSRVLDTGLSLSLLQEYVFISLDIFRNIVCEITRELDAWLLFLSSVRPADIARILCAFPEFFQYYEEIRSALPSASKTLQQTDGNKRRGPGNS